MLTAMSLLPSLVPAADLPRSNARLELARAIVSLAAPFVAGLLAQHLSPTWGYALAAVGAAVALACIIALPKAAAPTAGDQRPSMAAAIQAGARFVVRHELLRGISLCAIFWNFAFFALLAVWAPLALGLLKLDPASMGLAQSAYGAGLILGALVAPVSSKRLPPLATLIFGPAVSVIAAALFLLAPSGNGFAFAAAGHFLIGFGPMLWLICQTTVRQLVTPAPMLGRVNATRADGDLRRAAAGRAGRRHRCRPGRPAGGAAADRGVLRAVDAGDRPVAAGAAARPAAAGRGLERLPLDPRPPPVEFIGGGR